MANLRSSCHVFLSFEGETRNTFTCFLYESLKNEGFKVFMDEDANGTGDKLNSRIQEGIKTSMSAIVVFSKNYASSTCCLDELLLVLERNKTSRYFILPIFYDVNPEEIRHQTGSYHTALTKHEERHHDKVDKWRQALKEVANIRGEHVHGRQSTFIQNIVHCFRHKLSAEFPECLLPSPNIPVAQENHSCASPGDKSAILQIEPDNASSSDTSDLSSLSECKEVCTQIIGKIVTLTVMVCAILFLIFWSNLLSNMIKSWPDF